MKRHTVYEVEPVVREIPVGEMSEDAQRGVDLILDSLKQSGQYPYSHGGGGGGYLGLKDAFSTRLDSVVEGQEDCYRGYCSLELECDGVSQGNANEVVVELRCNGAQLTGKNEAEEFEASRENCSLHQGAVADQLEERLSQIPERVTEAAFALQDANAQVRVAQTALKDAYNL